MMTKWNKLRFIVLSGLILEMQTTEWLLKAIDEVCLSDSDSDDFAEIEESDEWVY